MSLNRFLIGLHEIECVKPYLGGVNAQKGCWTVTRHLQRCLGEAVLTPWVCSSIDQQPGQVGLPRQRGVVQWPILRSTNFSLCAMSTYLDLTNLTC